jgi:hypothetical protein
MRRIFLVVASSLSFGAGLSSVAESAMIWVSPTNPTSTDSVKVNVGDWYGASCWTQSEAGCLAATPETLSVVVTVNYCSGAPSCMCTFNPGGYQRTCNFGPLPVGTYVAKFTEIHINSFDPIPTTTVVISFTVGTSTPSLRRSWAGVKTIYR